MAGGSGNEDSSCPIVDSGGLKGQGGKSAGTGTKSSGSRSRSSTRSRLPPVVSSVTKSKEEEGSSDKEDRRSRSRRTISIRARRSTNNEVEVTSLRPEDEVSVTSGSSRNCRTRTRTAVVVDKSVSSSSASTLVDEEEVFLGEEELEVISKQDLVAVYRRVILQLEKSNRRNQDETNHAKDAEKIRAEYLDLSRRHKVALMRLTTQERQQMETEATITELKKSVLPVPGSLRSSLLDPAVNLIVTRMKKELDDTKKKLEDTQNDLNAWKFTPDSNTGKRLMAKCRMLYQENEDLGKMISGGRLAKLESDLALQKSLTDEMKKSQSELDELVQELDEDVEGMQSTICFLQTQLRESKQEPTAGASATGPSPSDPNSRPNSVSCDPAAASGLVVQVSLSSLCASCRSAHEPTSVSDDTKIRTRPEPVPPNNREPMEVEVEDDEDEEGELRIVTDNRTCVLNGETPSSPSPKSSCVQNVVNSTDEWREQEEIDTTDGPPVLKRTKFPEVTSSLLLGSSSPPLASAECGGNVNGNGAMEH